MHLCDWNKCVHVNELSCIHVSACIESNMHITTGFNLVDKR